MSVLGIFGTMHSEEIRANSNFDLEAYEALIMDFSPDIICGEVRPEDWESHLKDESYTGYLGPNEYRKLILPLCEREAIQFVPIDWFDDECLSLDYFEGMTQKRKQEIEAEFSKLTEHYISLGQSSEIPFNSIAFNEYIERKQDFQHTINPEVHKIYWTKRNDIMISRVQETMKQNPGKRILCTVGVEHVYLYCKHLQDRNWDIVFPVK